MSQRVRSVVVAAYIVLCMLLGGSAQGMWTNLVLQIGGVALLALAAIAGARTEEEATPSRFPSLLLLAALIIVLFQLVPLPAALWTNLPGREPIVAGIRALGYDLPPLPISEAPYATVATLFAFIPAVAVFSATQTLRPSPRAIFYGIVIGTVLGVVVGALQVAGGRGSWAYLYPFTSGGAVGFFANGNHMGTLLLITIPLIAASVASAKSERKTSKMSRYAIGGAALFMVLVGIALNGSLAAFGLAIPVVIASAAVVPAGLRWRRPAISIAALLLLAGVGMLAARPVGSDLMEQKSSSVSSRMEIWQTTAQAIGDNLPVGTGLGTFGKVYHLYERPSAVTSEYVNHAHNEYLELVLELGVPGLVLIILFLAWWLVSAVRIWTSPLSSPFARAATIATAAVLAHSVVDFPLRTAAISAIFAAAVAVMAQHFNAPASAKRGDRRPNRHVKLG